VGIVRRRRILARGALRTALGRHLEVSPETISFAYDPDGKPGLASPRRRQPVCFSVSYSGDCCLVAIADTDVGIDVEKLEQRLDLDAIAEQFFDPGEAAAIKFLSGDRKVYAFFRCWTCKEALIKAMGGGLASRSLDGLVVSLEGDDPMLLASEYGDPRSWTLAMPRMAPPWIAAIALRRPSGSSPLTLRTRTLGHDLPAAFPSPSKSPFAAELE
jgi:4'-phosphopantetheinyl transferase